MKKLNLARSKSRSAMTTRLDMDLLLSASHAIVNVDRRTTSSSAFEVGLSHTRHAGSGDGERERESSGLVHV